MDKLLEAMDGQKAKAIYYLFLIAAAIYFGPAIWTIFTR